MFPVAGLVVCTALGCGRRSGTSESPSTAPSAVQVAASLIETSPPLVTQGVPCDAPGLSCLRFDSNEAAFRWILSKRPLLLAVGEAHAQKGTEAVASATRRFTESMLPLLEGRASDLLVEAWAADPACQGMVKQVASAQKPVTQAQAQTNTNEYVTLGVRAKALGMTPHLLRPTCGDFADLADAGPDVVTWSLGLIKRLTQERATTLFERNQRAGAEKLVVTYGGAMHNDLELAGSLGRYSFGPELAALTGGQMIELDLIVPEYIKETEVWQKLPWFASFQALRARDGSQPGTPAGRALPTLYRFGERSFVLIFAPSAEGAAPDRASAKPETP